LDYRGSRRWQIMGFWADNGLKIAIALMAAGTLSVTILGIPNTDVAIRLVAINLVVTLLGFLLIMTWFESKLESVDEN
jgi:hypothetical protein